MASLHFFNQISQAAVIGGISEVEEELRTRDRISSTGSTTHSETVVGSTSNNNNSKKRGGSGRSGGSSAAAAAVAANKAADTEDTAEDSPLVRETSSMLMLRSA